MSGAKLKQVVAAARPTHERSEGVPSGKRQRAGKGVAHARSGWGLAPSAERAGTRSVKGKLGIGRRAFSPPTPAKPRPSGVVGAARNGGGDDSEAQAAGRSRGLPLHHADTRCGQDMRTAPAAWGVRIPSPHPLSASARKSA